LFSTESRAALPSNPPLAYGAAVKMDPTTGNVRQLVIGDNTDTDVYGITARAFPEQMGSAQGPYGQQPLGAAQAIPSPPQPVSIMRMGYILVNVNGTPAPGGAVFVWAAPTAAPHTQGGFEAATSAGNTIAIASTKTTWSSGPDANGVAELAFNI
jgi:hypothetical protein